MEITRIREIANPSAIETFYIKAIDIDKVSLSAGAINIINFDKTKLSKIELIFSDSQYSQTFINESIDCDNKYSVIFNDKIEYVNKFIILKNVVTNEFFVIEQISKSYSPENHNDAVYVAVMQKLIDFENTKNIKLVFTEENESEVEFYNKLLIQDVFKENTGGIWEKQPIKENWMPMIVTPLSIENKQLKLFFSTLSRFSNFDVRTLKVNSNFELLTQENLDIDFFISEIEKIKTNQDLIMSGFAGKDQTFINDFKSKEYGGSNVSEYVDYKIYELFNASKLQPEVLEQLIKMCSGWLKSSYCVDGGYTNNHKFLIPFYLDRKGAILSLKSKFYNLVVNEKGYIDIAANNITSFSNTQDLDYPIIPKELKEVNVNISAKETTLDDLKYRVNLILPKNVTDSYEFLYKTNPALSSGGSQYTQRKEFVLTSEAAIDKLTIIKLNEIFRKLYPEWTIDSREIYITVGETNFSRPMYTPTFSPADEGAQFYQEYNGIERFINFKYIPWDYVTWNAKSKRKLNDGENTLPKLTWGETRSHSDKWPKKHYAGPPNSMGSGRKFNSYAGGVECYKITFMASKEKKDAIKDYPLWTQVLFKHNFIFTEENWIEFNNTIKDNDSLIYTIKANEKLIFKGMFFPKFINIGEENYRLPNIQNLTELIITQIE